MRVGRHAAGRRARRRPADRRRSWPGSARCPSSATACGSPTPRPSTSPAWCWSARSTATSSRPSTSTARWPSAVRRGRRPHHAPTPRDPDLGFVGDVDAVNPAILERLLAEDLIPVVATIGTDDDGPGLQHQRRHRRRRHRRGARRREAHLPDRRRRASARDADDPSTPDLARPPPPSSTRMHRRRHRRRRHDPQGRGRACGAVRGGVGPAHILDGRRAPRAAARALHRRRRRHHGHREPTEAHR